jgi:hypothetical protein
MHTPESLKAWQEAQAELNIPDNWDVEAAEPRPRGNNLTPKKKKRKKRK